MLGACTDKPIEIYPMGNIWEVYKSYGNHKHEYYVVYNTGGKSPQEIENSILEFNRKTISIDTILKYDASYIRRFFKKTRTLTPDYKEEGNDAILDHSDDSLLAIRWTRCRNSLICINGGGAFTERYFEYQFRLSEANLDSILNPVLKTKIQD